MQSFILYYFYREFLWNITKVLQFSWQTNIKIYDIQHRKVQVQIFGLILKIQSYDNYSLRRGQWKFQKLLKFRKKTKELGPRDKGGKQIFEILKILIDPRSLNAIRFFPQRPPRAPDGEDGLAATLLPKMQLLCSYCEPKRGAIRAP